MVRIGSVTAATTGSEGLAEPWLRIPHQPKEPRSAAFGTRGATIAFSTALKADRLVSFSFDALSERSSGGVPDQSRCNYFRRFPDRVDQHRGLTGVFVPPGPT